jgi:hypothetical protein
MARFNYKSWNLYDSNNNHITDRRRIIRFYKDYRRHPYHPKWVTGERRAERPIRFNFIINLSDIGDCKVFTYESDYAIRNPCFYIKALNSPFRTCIELFDNKYIEEAARYKLTDKQAEELYNYMDSDDMLHDGYKMYRQTRINLYIALKDQWWHENENNIVFKKLIKDDTFKIYNVEIPDYRLLNKGDKNE